MKLLNGDCIEEMANMEDESVHCCVTSPPYYGLRNYNIDCQIGLEKTPEEYVARLVEVFREVRRVLRRDGVCWLNLGDSYASGKGTCYNPGGGDTSLGKVRKAAGAHPLDRGNVSDLRDQGLKPKDLIGIPWRVAFALQADGWYLRSDIIWHKPNPMPESVTDRCTKAHEYVFMLTKSGSPTFWTHRDHEGTASPPTPDYRWINNVTEEETAIEPEGWREAVYYTIDGKTPRLWRRVNLWRCHDYFYDAEAVKEPSTSDYRENGRKRNPDKVLGSGFEIRGGLHSQDGSPTRNRRDVWTITTKPYKGAHFAVFPEALAEVCIKAGTSERGCCPICGAPWARVVEHKPASRVDHIEPNRAAKANIDHGSPGIPCGRAMDNYTTTLGFRPSCDCGADPVPCVVLDPFAGSGTTGAVAKSLGRDYILIEANPDYIQLIKERIAATKSPAATLDAFF